MLPTAALAEIREPLIELGRRWAASSSRPKPTRETLVAWDKLLDEWVQSEMPLVLRDSKRRGESIATSTGRMIVFGDNSPANWSFGLALGDQVPDIRLWRREKIGDYVPLTFLTKGKHGNRDLNKAGWKICHIDRVSDRKRQKLENVPPAEIEARFRRFLSPRNMFLIPIALSGAGELREVIDAVAEYDRQAH